MENRDSQVAEILYLAKDTSGGFKIVSKEQATIVKITLKDGRVVWAFPSSPTPSS